MDFLKKIKYAIDFNKAFLDNGKKKYENSLLLLEKHRNLAFKYRNNIPDYFILYAENLAMLKRLKESEKYFLEAMKILEETTIFNNDEINYLKSYLISWIQFLKNDKYFKSYKFKKLVNSEFEFDLGNVRKSLQINFPLDFSDITYDKAD